MQSACIVLAVESFVVGRPGSEGANILLIGEVLDDARQKVCKHERELNVAAK